MFGSEVLEIATGMVFVFLVTSLVASIFREILESILKTRAVQLERGIRQLLDDPDGAGATQALFSHPQLYALFPGVYDPSRLKSYLLSFNRPKVGEDALQTIKRFPLASNLPAYIPSRNFALALMNVVGAYDDGGPLTLEGLKATTMTLPPGRLQQALLSALGEAGDDLGRVRSSLEAWFDSNMDRVSSWYKRETQWILLAVGFVLAVALNVDSVGIAHDLATNNGLRQKAVAEATQAAKDLRLSDPELKPNGDQLRQQLDGLSDIVGWKAYARREPDDKILARDHKAPGPAHVWYAVELLLGWTLSALAVSMGAPFWFDILNKIMVVRSTVKPAQKSPSEGSADRAGSPSAADALEAVSPAPAVRAAPASPTATAPANPIVALRLAVDLSGLEANSLKLVADGAQVAVSPDGFVELPLEVDMTHQLSATAKRDGAEVSWSQTIAPHLNNEGMPIAVLLAKAPTS